MRRLNAFAVLWLGAAACLPSEQCLRTNYVYNGTKNGTLWKKTLAADGTVYSASGVAGGIAGAADAGTAPQDCFGPSGPSTGQVIAWIDATGAEEGSCTTNPMGFLCAPRLCDPQGHTPYQLSGSLTTITVVLTVADAGCL
jgi:hypothetical protein